LNQRIHEVGEPIRFDLDLGQEITTCRFVPVHIGSAKTADEAFYMAQRQAKLVRGRSQELIASSVGRHCVWL
jgi:hypothetical protein